MNRTLLSLSLASLMGVVGCASTVGAALDSAARQTGQTIGSAVGARAASAVAARMPAVWTPDLTALYMNYLFTLAFHSGSYTFDAMEYEPGEWTRWRLTDAAEEGPPPEMERAFLHRTDAGQEWWRVKYVAQAEEGADSITVEALFDPESGEFRRMRTRMPGEDEAKEMPVEEGTYGYVAPRRLTAESLEGATVGTASVRVPAGTYTARHVRYGSVGQGTMEWWLSDNVPGGMVKYGASGESRGEGLDTDNWTVELMASGTGASSELGVRY